MTDAVTILAAAYSETFDMKASDEDIAKFMLSALDAAGYAVIKNVSDNELLAAAEDLDRHICPKEMEYTERAKITRIAGLLRRAARMTTGTER